MHLFLPVFIVWFFNTFSVHLCRFYMTPFSMHQKPQHSSLLTLLAQTVFDVQLNDHCSWIYSFISTQDANWVKPIVTLPCLGTKLWVSYGLYLAGRPDLARFWQCEPGPIWADSQLQLAEHGPALAPGMGPVYLSWFWHIIHHESGLSPAIWHAGFRPLLVQTILQTRGFNSPVVLFDTRQSVQIVHKIKLKVSESRTLTGMKRYKPNQITSLGPIIASFYCFWNSSFHCILNECIRKDRGT